MTADQRPDSKTRSPASLKELLDEIGEAASDRDAVSLDNILDAIGRRSFAPILLLAGLVMVTPVIGDIPGVPVLMGLIVILTSAQLLLGRTQTWIPHWLSKRKVASDKLVRAVAWLQQPAGFVDRWTKPRLEWAVRHVFVHVIAITCILIAATTPALELVPFSATFAGLAISAFALALFTRDGLIAVFAMVFSLGVLAVLLLQFF